MYYNMKLINKQCAKSKCVTENLQIPLKGTCAKKRQNFFAKIVQSASFSLKEL